MRTHLCLPTWTAFDVVPVSHQLTAPFLLANSILPVTQYDVIVIKELIPQLEAGLTPRNL